MELEIKNKNALITGGGKGIGRSIAITLANEGVNICVISRTESELQEVCEEIRKINVKAIYKVLDLNDNNSLNSIKETINKELGSIDILVNNAAHTTIPKKLSYISMDDWYKTFDIDVNAVFKLIRLFIDDMKINEWGRIITIGSLSASFGASSYPAYCAAKAALEGLTKNLAIDYSKYGITINMISPGFVETERFKKAAPKELIEKFKSASSVKRLGKPEDVANAVAFLASDKSSLITGVNLMVCGGLNLNNLW